jgi:hypothetical protein
MNGQVVVGGGIVAAVVLIASLSGTGGPSVQEMRQQGYTDCRHFRNSLGPQIVDSSVKCIEGNKLIEFKDSVYFVHTYNN